MRKKLTKMLSILLTLCMVCGGIIVPPPNVKAASSWNSVLATGNSIQFKGTWGLNSGSKESNVKDSTVSLSFYGTGIRWIGQKDTNFGYGEVIFDDESLVEVNTFATGTEVGSDKVLYEKTGLPEKTHTITIKATGKKDPGDSGWNGGGYIDINRFEVEYDLAVPVDISKIVISSDATLLEVNSTVEIAMATEPYNASDSVITWNSSDQSVAKVENGIVTGMQPGETKITATSGEVTSNEITLNILEGTTITPAPLKKIVNNENPLYIENFYWGDTIDAGEVAWGRDDSPVLLWNSIPDTLKPYTVLNLIAEQGLRDTKQVKDWIQKYAKICSDNQIPFLIQAINGETGSSKTIPMDFWKTLENENSEYLMGFNAAELYNGPAFYPDAEGNYSDYVKNVIDICAENGMYWVWTDSNCFGTHGVLQDWMEQNQKLSNALRAYKDNIIMMHKETHATVAAEYLFMGMWLSDYCGNWGVSSDFWYWGNTGRGLFGEPGVANGERTTGDCLIYPDVLYVQTMLRVISQGGNCFLSEAQFYSNASMGKRTPTYQYAIIPFLEKVVKKEIKIPTKEEVLESNKVAIVGQRLGDRGDFAWANSINYNSSVSRINPKSAKYGILASLPSNAPQEALDKFETVFHKLPTKAELDAIYTEEKSTGTGWCENMGDTWYWMNSADNVDVEQNSTFVPKIHTNVKSFSISAHPHTYGVIKEETNKINVNLGNYRVSKSDLSYDPVWSDFKESMWFTYIWRLCDRMLTNSNPDKTLRDTIIQVTSDTEPSVKFKTPSNDGTYNKDVYVRPYDYSIAKTAEKEYTITIKHNGVVEFDILTSDVELPTELEMDSEAVVGRNLTFQLKAVPVPNGNIAPVISWESDNETVATVNSHGVVTGVKLGTANIKASLSNGVSASCEVSVVEVPVTGITPSKQSLSLYLGDTEKIDVTLEPELVSDPTVVWSSRNESIATVDQSGTITGVKQGTTMITVASAYEPKTEIEVTVLYNSFVKIPQSQMTITASSEETVLEKSPAVNVLDGDPETFWHTKYSEGAAALPHTLKVDLGGTYTVKKYSYLPRQSSLNGAIKKYELYLTKTDGTEEKVSEGNWVPDKQEKNIILETPVEATAVTLKILESVGNFGSAAEINVYRYEPEPEPEEPTVTKVEVTPKTAEVKQGESKQFSANVSGTGDYDRTVSWRLEGALNGSTIGAGGLVTIGAEETAKSLTVKAISNQDAGVVGTATITVKADTPVPPNPSIPEPSFPAPDHTTKAPVTVVKEEKKDSEGNVTEKVTSAGKESDNGEKAKTSITQDKDGTIKTISAVLNSTEKVETKEKTALISSKMPEDILAETVREALNSAGVVQGAKEETLSLYVDFPKTQVLEQLNKEGITDIDVQIALPDGNRIGMETQLQEWKISKDVLSAAVNQKKNLNVVVTDNKGTVLYHWDFSNMNKKKASLIDVNVAMNSRSIVKNPDLYQLSTLKTNKEEGIVLQFQQNGVLPCPMDVKIYVGNQKNAVSGKGVYLYYYNSKTKKLEELVNNLYTIDKDGYVKITIDHCSDYVILPTIESKKVVTSLLDKVTVTKSLSIKSKEQKSILVKNGEDAKITYSSSNKKVATVSKTGKVTGVKKGSCSIITKVTMNNKSKEFKTTIKVTK